MKIKEGVGAIVTVFGLLVTCVGAALLPPVEREEEARTISYDHIRTDSTLRSKMEFFRKSIKDCSFDKDRLDIAGKVFNLGKQGTDEDKSFAIGILNDISSQCSFSNTKREIAKLIMDI